MFARVITAATDSDGLQKFIELAQEQLPEASQRSGFAGYYLLAQPESENVLVISLWKTKEDMHAVASGTSSGVHESAIPGSAASTLQLATYEVRVHAGS